jgi:hypothetical protein
VTSRGEHDVLVIKLGVPARDGTRKACLVDGMELDTPSTTTMVHSNNSGLHFSPGVSTSKLVRMQVGYQDHDAFTSVQVFVWAHNGRTGGNRSRRFGFRGKQERAMRFDVRANCPCHFEPSEADLRA